MANLPLTGNSISSSYQGLLKTSDNTALSATEKPVVDGLANASTLKLGTTSASFTGTLDLSGATVTGLPAGSAGLESGSGADSMQSAASLTTGAANASGASTIALGDSATAPNDSDINIGDGNSIASKAVLPGDVVIGKGNNSSTVNGGQNVLIGQSNTVTQNERNAAIGTNNTISRGDHYILGFNNTTSSQYRIGVVGTANSATGENTFIGGHNSSATATGAVALGDGVTASTAQTVSVKALETQTNSTPTAGGIIMSDAGGTDRRINITTTGIPQIDSDPMLVNDSTTNVDMTKVWSGTEAQYTALGTYDANTLYFLT